MKTIKCIFCSAMMVLVFSFPSFSKTGTISTTKTGTISTTKTGTISTTAAGSLSPNRGGTISTTRATFHTNTNNLIELSGILELLLTFLTFR